MKHRISNSLLMSAFLFAVMAPTDRSTALGDVVLSNLASPNQGLSNGVNEDSWVASAFVTDSGSWRLTGVTISMDDIILAVNRGPFALSVYSDNNDVAPNSLLETLGGSTDPSVAGAYTYLAAGSGLLLDANTKYWLVASAAPGPTSDFFMYTWHNVQTLSTSGVWSIPSVNVRNSSTDQGATWNDLASNDPLQFAISASPVPVPEPTTCAMALAGIACGGFSMWRRRKRV